MPVAARSGKALPAWLPTGQASVATLPGVGPKIAEKLSARGLLSLQDLWLHLPLRYEDRTRLSHIAALRPGQTAQLVARVVMVERGFRYRPQLKVMLHDDAGHGLTLRFFHFSKNQAAQFQVGRRVLCFGEARPGQQGLEMVHPSYRFIADSEEIVLRDRLDPVYPAVDGVGAATLAKMISAALLRLPADDSLELLPAECLLALDLPTLREALLTVHQPPVSADQSLFVSGRSAAQKRLALEELLAHHLSLRRNRIALRQQGAVALQGAGALAARLIVQLPFALTQAQQRVLADIEGDLARPEPMLRLVQGDVGSGKTVVAAIAALRAIEAGQQVALVAPTELLAEQHHAAFSAWFKPLGLNVAWLAGKVGGRARSAVLTDIASGAAPMVVGTHALMQQGVAFQRLALCIIDEQHRFGVHQRMTLRDKGVSGSRVPHQLVMTATPIPRTLAMSAYADLDVSVIDELPPGRSPVQTVVINGERRGEVVDRIHAACAEGRQAYWVCTLIDESEEIAAQSAQATFETLTTMLPGLRLGLLHGRMKPADKQAVMADFKSGELQLLVATTVIEVGVDVPRASMMIIENAERLGLAQLHQLRGRVGRGSAQSTCVLLYQSPLSSLARERLDVLRNSGDGFVIAEKDLELRGPGELLGTRQTGVVSFRIADLARDASLLPTVHSIAEHLLAELPDKADALIARWVGGASRFASA